MLSIIIPVYNQLEYLKKCLKSIEDNTKYPYNLILIDSGCNVETRNYIQKHDLNIQFNKNIGFTKAINAGIITSFCYDNDLIIMLNQNIEVYKSWDEILIMNFQRDTVVSLYDEDRIYRGSGMNSACVLFHKKQLDRVGLWDSRFFMSMSDVDYFYRLKKYDISPKVINFPIKHYRSKSVDEYDIFIERDKRTFEKKWGIEFNNYEVLYSKLFLNKEEIGWL